jgi:hypothetical protein
MTTTRTRTFLSPRSVERGEEEDDDDDDDEEENKFESENK